MLLLGLCALVQCAFLPGFLAARALGVTGALRTATTAFALSLLLNWVLVAGLVMARAYARPVVLAIFAFECLLALLLLRRHAGGQNRLEGFGRRRPRAEAIRLDLKTWLALFLTLTVLAGYVLILLQNAGRIFTGWDDVVSWNHWAVEWSRGHPPAHTWHYPQLLPANWSLTYVFMGDERIQFFARGLMPFFGIATIVAVARLARGPEAFMYLMAAAIGGQLLKSFNDVTAGLADVPAAFFATTAIAELIGARSAPDGDRTRRVALGAAFAAGAALTKQAGLYLAAVYPVLALALVQLSAGRLRMLALLYGLIVVLALPWYAFKEAEIRSGRETSEISYVTHDIHQGAAPAERLTRALALVAKRWESPVMLAAIAGLLLVGLSNRTARWITAFVTVPYALIWGLWFSYDRRNLALALVPCAIGCAAGLDRLLRGRLTRELVWRPAGLLRLVPQVSGRAVVAGAGVALLGLWLAIPGSVLRERQELLQRTIGDPELNRALYSYEAVKGIPGKILTSYALLAYLPGLGSRCASSHLDDLEAFKSAAASPSVSHLLIPRTAAPQIRAELERGLETGRYSRAFETRDYVFVKREDWPP